MPSSGSPWTQKSPVQHLWFLCSQIPWNGTPVPKHAAVGTYRELCFMLCTVLYCWLIYCSSSELRSLALWQQTTTVLHRHWHCVSHTHLTGSPVSADSMCSAFGQTAEPIQCGPRGSSATGCCRHHSTYRCTCCAAASTAWVWRIGAETCSSYLKCTCSL